MTAAVASAGEIATLHELNRGYVRAAQNSDVKWYAGHLDENYRASNPDGSLVGRKGFLERIAKQTPGRGLETVDPRIRIIDGVGVIQSGFRYLKPDGQPGTGCYTDIWSRHTGNWLCIAAHFALFHVPMQSAPMIGDMNDRPDDRATLDELNHHYIRSVRESDARWFDANLDADFLNTNADGSISERAVFLANIARPSAVKNLDFEAARITFIGEAALAQARTKYIQADGAPGMGRYTDLWLRRKGRWVCVSAHVTRG